NGDFTFSTLTRSFQLLPHHSLMRSVISRQEGICSKDCRNYFGGGKLSYKRLIGRGETVIHSTVQLNEINYCEVARSRLQQKTQAASRSDAPVSPQPGDYRHRRKRDAAPASEFPSKIGRA